eukprot:m.141367 g.141367  ORF g.141367 m.141367 type:complete len:194 (+) comp30183_c4_seq2:192-773(+)
MFTIMVFKCGLFAVLMLMIQVATVNAGCEWGTLDEGCGCSVSAYNVDDNINDDAEDSYACSSNCCQDGFCRPRSSCERWFIWVVVVGSILALCCVAACGYWIFWCSNPNSSRNRPPPQAIGTIQMDNMDSRLMVDEESLDRPLEVICPNVRCAVLLSFPMEAAGNEVQCGMCQAIFPLQSLRTSSTGTITFER